MTDVVIDYNQIAMLLGAIITIAGIVFGYKGIALKKDLQKTVADVAALLAYGAALTDAPTADQLIALQTMVNTVIQDFVLLGGDFSAALTKANNEVMAKKLNEMIAAKRTPPSK